MLQTSGWAAFLGFILAFKSLVGCGPAACKFKQEYRIDQLGDCFN